MAESKAQNYILYTLGEVVLVIIGILIALQVNNWNEERIELRQIREHARALVSDLERDIVMVRSIVKQMQRTLDNVDALNSYVHGKSLDRIDNLDLYYLTFGAGYRPYQWNRAAVEQLKASDGLRKIRNAGLVRKITAYDSFTHHLDEDFFMDREIFMEATRRTDEVVDLSYRINEQAITVWQEIYSEPYAFPSPKLHELYKEAELHLLTNDIDDVKVLVNKFEHLQTIRARTEGEIPRLLEDARELIEMLKSEYPGES